MENENIKMKGPVRAVEFVQESEVQEVKDRLIELQSENDHEAAHIEADGVLCDFVTKLGFEDVVEEYQKINRQFL
jgi:chromosome segregation and condensation protein ScpB